MWRRHRAPLLIVRQPETPTGNVRVTPSPVAPREPAPEEALPEEPSAGWSIRDANGEVVRSGLLTRAAALREIGVVAIRGRNAPYEIIDPLGRPSGDRLP